MANLVTIGLECKTYFLSTGTRATWNATVTNGAHVGAAPSNLTEAKVIKDVTLNLEASEADVSNRSSTWKLVRKALKDGNADLTIPWNTSDAVFSALLAAFLVTGQTIAMAILDGDKATAGSQGLWADFEVMSFTREEPLEGGVVAKVKIRPGATAVAPEWVQVA